jgi:CDP-paratose 2-epimerase
MPKVDFSDWRVGDQRYYVSDTRKFQAATGWAPRVGVREGVGRLYDWLAGLPAAPAAPEPAAAVLAGGVS